MRGADLHPQLLIPVGPPRRRPLLPRIKTAGGDAQRPTALGHRELGPLRGNPGKPYCWCFAKKAAAFFKMSRSVRNSRFSFRSRANSSRSAVVRPVRPCVRSAQARLTHSRSAVSVRSRSRAAAPTVLPPSSTKPTALALNSSVNWRRDGGSVCRPSVWTSYSPLERCPPKRIKPTGPNPRVCREARSCCERVLSERRVERLEVYQ